MSFSIVIPSRSSSNLVPCIRAIREAGEAARIIVVDDGLPSDTFAGENTGLIEIVSGVKPFVFARNVNIGIRAAGDDDVILLNDDALLKTPAGFTALAGATLVAERCGLAAAACDTVGNPNQFRRAGTVGTREEPRMVCFVCVYIPRSTIKTVGLLDERFGGIDDRGQEIYGFCDDDYSYRVRLARLKLGIFDGCFVDHGSLPSSFRSEKPKSLEPGQRQFIMKHGVDNWMNGKDKSPWSHLFA